MENVALNSVSCTDSTKAGLISFISWEKTISYSNMHFNPLEFYSVSEHAATPKQTLLAPLNNSCHIN